MANPLVQTIKQLYDDNLYDYIIDWGEILLEPTNQIGFPKDHIRDLTAQQSFQLLTYFGEALIHCKYFRRAIRIFKECLTLLDTSPRRTSKRKSANSDKDQTFLLNENDIKHKLYYCHIGLNNPTAAIAALESIPKPERSVEILRDLARLYSQENFIDKAKATYREILIRRPESLGAIIELCKLSVGDCSYDVMERLLPQQFLSSFNWLPTWIKAQCTLYSNNQKIAIKWLDSLSTKFNLYSPSILSTLAQAHYHEGNYKESNRLFKVAFNNDDLAIKRIDCYAASLHKDNQIRELEDLTARICEVCPQEGQYFYEHWLVMARYNSCLDQNEGSRRRKEEDKKNSSSQPKALLFAKKAIKINKDAVESLILLGELYFERKEYGRSLSYTNHAHVQAPYRFEVQKLLCHAFLEDNKKPMALRFAQAAIKALGESARSYHLYADIILRSGNARKKNEARNCLEKAVRYDPSYLPAVLNLSELYIEEKHSSFDKAISVLTAALTKHHTNKEIHKKLYICYTGIEDHPKALYHEARASE